PTSVFSDSAATRGESLCASRDSCFARAASGVSTVKSDWECVQKTGTIATVFQTVFGKGVHALTAVKSRPSSSQKSLGFEDSGAAAKTNGKAGSNGHAHP